MKKPCPPALRQGTPGRRLKQGKPPGWGSCPDCSTGAPRAGGVAPAHTTSPRPVVITSRPWPKSVSVLQLDGLAGGDQTRSLMSQRARPAPIAQPMFFDGVWKDSSCTTVPGVGLVSD